MSVIEGLQLSQVLSRPTPVVINERRSWTEVWDSLPVGSVLSIEVFQHELFPPTQLALDAVEVEIAFLTFRCEVVTGMVLKEARRHQLFPLRPQAGPDVHPHLPILSDGRWAVYLGAVEVIESSLRVVTRCRADGEEVYGLDFYDNLWPRDTIFPMRRFSV